MSRSCKTTAILAAFSLAVLEAVVACGGTNGREGLPNQGNPPPTDQDGTVVGKDGSQDALSGDAAGNDATVETGADGSFDVTIQYADAARLPEVGLGESGGSDASAEAGVVINLPTCACDYIPANIALCPVPDDGGSCPTHVWTASERCDQCVRYLCEAPGSLFSFPPCCDIDRNAKASTGPGKGTPLFALCADVYSCAMQACSQGQCGTTSTSGTTPHLSGIFCGQGVITDDCENTTDPSKGPKGPCRQQIESAFQGLAPNEILLQLTSTVQAKPFSPGSEVLALVQCAIANCTQYCFSPDAGVVDSGPGDGAPPPTCM
jgi:hypothetical protein